MDIMRIYETVHHYAWVLRRRLKLILLGMAVGGLTTLMISVYLPPTYQARALIRANSAATVTGNEVYNAQALAVGYALLVPGPQVMQEAARILPGTNANSLGAAISAAPVDNTQIIEVRAQGDTPRQAADRANTVANVFIQLQVAKETARLEHTIDQLSENLVTARVTVDSAQQRVMELQNAHAAIEAIAEQKGLLDTDQANYNSLLSTYNQFQTQKLQAVNLLSLDQAATPPDKPISPQVALNTLLAICMSLLLMMVLALLLDWLDITIKTPEDVVHLVGLQPLGSIPASTSSPLLTLSTESSDVTKDALFLLGTGFLAVHKNVRSLLVTGICPGSGTTTVAIHLAISLAQAGKRVLLIDANLHRPLLHQVFNRSNTYGLVNSLVDAPLLDAQPGISTRLWLNRWQTQIPNLWMLPTGHTGQPPAHGSAVLRTPGLRMLHNRLLGLDQAVVNQHSEPAIDMVIFDTPALKEVNDAQALTALVDETVLVVAAGKERKETVQDISQAYRRLGAPVTGVVLNRQQPWHRSYFYVSHQRSQEHVYSLIPALQSDTSSPDQSSRKEQQPVLAPPAQSPSSAQSVPSVQSSSPTPPSPIQPAQTTRPLTQLGPPAVPSSAQPAPAARSLFRQLRRERNTSAPLPAAQTQKLAAVHMVTTDTEPPSHLLDDYPLLPKPAPEQKRSVPSSQQLPETPLPLSLQVPVRLSATDQADKHRADADTNVNAARLQFGPRLRIHNLSPQGNNHQ